MPGAVVSPTFPVAGTYVNTVRKDETEDRNYLRRTEAVLSVKVTKGASTYGPFGVTTSGNQWSATATVPPGTGYTVTASITDGTDIASHSIETIDVEEAPLIIIENIDPPPLKAADTPLEKKAHKLEGKHLPADADGIFAFPYTLLLLPSVSGLPEGGKHYHVSYRFGSPVSGEGRLGDVDKDKKKWKLKELKVEPHQFVMVFLERKGQVIATNSSRLF
jgi:hypothetical protein